MTNFSAFFRAATDHRPSVREVVSRRWLALAEDVLRGAA